MKARVVAVDSRNGISAALLEKAGLTRAVEVRIGDRSLLVREAGKPRAGWDENFRAAKELGDDDMEELRGVDNAFDREEWEW